MDEERVERTYVTILAFCFLNLKCGSGNRKKILDSWPLAKKLGMCFMLLARMTETFWYPPALASDESAGREDWIWREARMREET